MRAVINVLCKTGGVLEIYAGCGRVYRTAAYAGQKYRFRLPPGEYALRLSGDTTSSAFLDLRCPCQSCVYVTLPLQINSGNAKQSFTLSDATYNLPINGVLFFTSPEIRNRFKQ